jgi:hypothetical protein
MIVDLNVLSVGIGLIITLLGIGYKIANILGDIRISITRIEYAIDNHNDKFALLEHEVKNIKLVIALIKETLK